MTLDLNSSAGLMKNQQYLKMSSLIQKPISLKEKARSLICYVFGSIRAVGLTSC